PKAAKTNMLYLLDCVSLEERPKAESSQPCCRGREPCGADLPLEEGIEGTPATEQVIVPPACAPSASETGHCRIRLGEFSCYAEDSFGTDAPQGFEVRATDTRTCFALTAIRQTDLAFSCLQS